MYLNLGVICGFTFFFLPEVMISEEYCKLGGEHPNSAHNLADRTRGNSNTLQLVNPILILENFWMPFISTENIISGWLLQKEDNSVLKNPGIWLFRLLPLSKLEKVGACFPNE